ncbi:MAG: response regulator [Helicobacteraceae bacterium]|nr:response regulator [Candidatus Sulfurimonas ponti]MBL6973926.1 response regulator [Sulfurimonas sp.]
MKLLYVEDEIQVREGTGTFLNKFFDNLTIAIDGQDGLEKFQKSLDFDIVMTDLNMPGLNGMQMIESIKELKKDIIVVYFSADEVLDSIVEDEKTYIVKKPVAIEKFVEMLEKIGGRI